MILPNPKPQQSTVAPEPPLRSVGNTLMGRNPLGMWVEGPIGGADFRHPWLVTVGAAGARVGKGFVLAEIAVEPVIGKVPISGDDRNPAPVLQLDDGVINKAGETWVCVQVRPDKDGKVGKNGKLSEGAEVRILQSAYPYEETGPAARAPLACLVRRGATWRVYQVAYFHMRFVTSIVNGKRRSFFL